MDETSSDIESLEEEEEHNPSLSGIKKAFSVRESSRIESSCARTAIAYKMGMERDSTWLKHAGWQIRICHN